MSWAATVDYTEDVLTVAALAGAIWSAIVFVRKISADKEADRKAQVDDWLKVEIHRVLANSKQMLNVEQIVSALRSASFVTDVKFDKKELSEANIRLLLLSMVEQGVLGQRWPDSFGITQLPFDVSTQLVVDNIKGNRAVRRAYALIVKHPGQYDNLRLWNEIGEETELSEADFYLVLSELQTRGVAHREEDGKWFPMGPAGGGGS